VILSPCGPASKYGWDPPLPIIRGQASSTGERRNNDEWGARVTSDAAALPVMMFACWNSLVLSMDLGEGPGSLLRLRARHGVGRGDALRFDTFLGLSS
jgi:hypothetical protein